MSDNMETIDGERFEVGFYSSDTTKFLLGDLSPMTIEQFCEYSAETVSQIVTSRPEPEYSQIASYLSLAEHAIAELKVRTVESPYSDFSDVESVKDDFMHGEQPIQRALAGEGLSKMTNNNMGKIAVYYSENPFILQAERVIVSQRYEVKVEEFAWFALYYLGGGSFGWNRDLGIPQQALDAINKIKSSLDQRRGQD